MDRSTRSRSQLSSAMAPVGLLIAGPVADTYGIESWYVIAGVLPMIMIAIAFFRPKIMDLDQNGSAVANGTAGSPAAASSEAD